MGKVEYERIRAEVSKKNKEQMEAIKAENMQLRSMIVEREETIKKLKDEVRRLQGETNANKPTFGGAALFGEVSQVLKAVNGMYQQGLTIDV